MSSVIWKAAIVFLLHLRLALAFYPYEPDYSKPSKFKALSNPSKRDNAYPIVSSNPPTQQNSVAIDQDGTDYTYVVSMTFGTSTKVYHMLVDSGAVNSWVMSSDCKSQACSTHSLFGPSDSSTLKVGSKSFSITYGSGNVNGTWASDDVHFAGSTFPMDFAVVNQVSQEFASFPMDGILGFGAGTQQQDGTPKIMDVMASKGLIKAKQFGVHLSRYSSGVNDGELNLGAPNTARYDGQLSYVPMTGSTDDSFWEIPLDDAAVDGKTMGFKGRTTIMDTGSSFIFMPPKDAVTVHQAIPGSKQNGADFTIPCSSTAVVALVLGGVAYNISSKDYVGSKIDSSTCGSNLVGQQVFGTNQWLVGDVFFKNVYTVFDYDGSRIGLGVKSTAASTSSSVSVMTATPSVASQSGKVTPVPLGGSSTSPGASSMVSSVASSMTSVSSVGFLPPVSSGSSSGASSGSPSAAASATAASAQSGTPSATATPTHNAAGLIRPSADSIFALLLAIVGVLMFG